MALGASFLSAVADRLGFWGAPGDKNVAWGNWTNFLDYTGMLSFGTSDTIINIMGYSASFLEVLLGILLIIGYKIKAAAFASGILLLLFATAMAFNLGIKAALDYSVFSAAFGAFLLGTQVRYNWSLDAALR